MDSKVSAVVCGKNVFESCRARFLAPRRRGRLRRVARSGAPRHAALPCQSRRSGCGGSGAERPGNDSALRERGETSARVVHGRIGKARCEDVPQCWEFPSREFRAKRTGTLSEAGEARDSSPRAKQGHRARVCAHHHWNAIRNAAVAEDNSKGMEDSGVKSGATSELTMHRPATIHRKTNETDIRLRLNLDGRGKARIATGIRFFDHMLELVTRHGAFDLHVDRSE